MHQWLSLTATPIKSGWLSMTPAESIALFAPEIFFSRGWVREKQFFKNIVYKVERDSVRENFCYRMAKIFPLKGRRDAKIILDKCNCICYKEFVLANIIKI
jgi:hypothetical protein